MLKKVIFLSVAGVVLLAGLRSPVAATREANPVPLPVIGEQSPGDSEHLKQRGDWPFGYAETVAVDELRDLVFLGSGGAVLVIDAQDPAELKLVSDEIRTNGYVADLAYNSSVAYLYVAADEGGFEIWDLSDPHLPTRLSSIEVYYFGVEVPVNAVTLWGDFAYVAAEHGYVHWIDISDPENPVDMGFNGSGVGNPAVDVHASGGFVYAVGANLARFAIYGDGSLHLSGYRETYIGSSVYAEGGLVYAVIGGLYILDGTNPYLPTLSYLTIGARDVYAAGNLAYVASGADGLTLLDVTDPSNPVILGNYDSQGYVNQVVLKNDTAYFADGSSMGTADVSDPYNPALLGTYDTFTGTTDAHITGNRAYLAEDIWGIVVLDISDRTDPVLLGQYDTPGSASDIAVVGCTGYIADYTGGFHIVDFSDPSTPVELGSLTTFDPWLIKVRGNYAYIVEAVPNEPYYMKIVDISEPSLPVEIGSLQVPTLVSEIEIQGDYAYLATYYDGIRIIDISDPSAPYPAAVYNAPDAIDIDVRGDYAYVASADWAGGFLILDISDPTDPRQESLYNPSGWFHPFHVTVAGDYAYVSEMNEIHLFDISNPASPVRMESILVPLDVFDLNAVGRTLYVSDNSAGLRIWDNTLLPQTAFEPVSLLK